MNIYTVKECDFCQKKDIEGERIYKCDICNSFSCCNHDIKVLSDELCLCVDCIKQLKDITNKDEKIYNIKFRYTYLSHLKDGTKIDIIEQWLLQDIEDMNVANLYGTKIKTELGTFYIEQKVIKKEIFIAELNKWFTIWEKNCL